MKRRLLFPQKLTVNNINYLLAKQYTIIDDFHSISEGPFYEVEGELNNTYWYLPDVSYCEGITENPEIMHKIQKPFK